MGLVGAALSHGYESNPAALPWVWPPTWYMPVYSKKQKLPYGDDSRCERGAEPFVMRIQPRNELDWCLCEGLEMLLMQNLSPETPVNPAVFMKSRNEITHNSQLPPAWSSPTAVLRMDSIMSSFRQQNVFLSYWEMNCHNYRDNWQTAAEIKQVNWPCREVNIP